MAEKKQKQLIGRAEKIDFPELGLTAIPAKIDTGADLSSIWVSQVRESAEGLLVVLFGPGSSFYTGEALVFSPKAYTITRIASSFGHKELRYRVKLSVRVKNKRINGTFTLADRKDKTYPVLLGRRLLHEKFVVDVSQGDPLIKEERKKKDKLRRELEEL